ncbi:MAG: Na+/H+ antiporter subunit E [Pseudomonadota bacterium]|nr:Na+/H+ antiporter subunit E [Pseudomonadota bacterium]
MEHPPPDVRPSFPHYLFTFGVVVLLWLLLAGSLRKEEILAAAVAGLIVNAVAGPRLAIFTGVRLSPLSLVHLVLYLVHFFGALVRANLDMARRVLTPSLPIRPAVVTVQTNLKSSLGKLLLANSITLTPGTLTVDVQDDRILVHWVDCPPGTDLAGATRAIAASFERRISGFLK